MQKLYLITCAIIIAFLSFADRAYAQAPAFTYPASLTLKTGQNMTPVKPTHTSGTVPQEVYSLGSNIAGSGGYGHADTIAGKSTFGYPLSAAIDRFGNIYVADANFNCIRRIKDGVVTTFAGSLTGEKGGRNGQGNATLFDFPTGVAVDSDGNVYVADFNNNLIRKITPGGAVSTFAGNQNSGRADGQGTNASFTLPYSIFVDHDNVLWVADTYNNLIRKILPDGTVSTVATIMKSPANPSQTIAATLSVPKGITKSNDGYVYVTEESGNQVRKIDPSTGMTTVFAKGRFAQPIGIAADDANNVYVSNENNFKIFKYTPDGKLVDSTHFPAFSGGDLKGVTNGTDTLTHYGGNMGLFFDGQNHLIVTDPTKDLIRQVAVNGYSVYPRLPDGLTLNEDGSISGAPKAVQTAKTYKITAYNSSGASNFDISISTTAGPQVITFNKPAAATYGDADFSPIATSNSNAQLIYSSDNPKIATIVNNKVHVVGAGTVNITASQPANTDYSAGAPVTQALVVNKAHLKAIAYHYYKTQTHDNPDFTVFYSGYLHGDTITVVKQAPVAQTTATNDSPPGDYPINITGGLADNYDFVYTPGVLTVFPLPVIAINGSSFIAKGDSVLLTATPTAGYALQWFKDGIKIPGATSGSCYAKVSGAYTFAVTKDGFTSTSLYVSISAQLLLPANNFSIKVTGVSCKGDNNGSIFISAAQSHKYIATVNGNGLINQQYFFTDTLTLSKLSPGGYSVCMSIQDETFNQCFQLNVTEPKDLSAYSTINKPDNSITLQLDGGSAYSINLNDQVYTTDKNEISLPLKAGMNKLIITTDKLCQGIIEKSIDMSGITAPYPNPFTGVLNVNIGNVVVNDIKVEVVNVLNGKTVHTDQLKNKSGVLQFDLSGIAAGIYYFNLNLDITKLGYKIIKK